MKLRRSTPRPASGARMARRLATVGAVASVAVLAAPSLASAAPSRGGMEHIRIVSDSNRSTSSIVIRGAFVDGGTDYAKGKRDVAVFADGGFIIHHPGGTFSFELNPRTCVAHLSGNGNYSIGGGFGAYRGVTGQGTYVFHGILTFGRNGQGRCAVHRAPTASQTIIRASGTMSK
ncbi:MAG: hypothetical protein QOI06_3032 [Nocardioidaceae bacterium]|jgi:hypothetical protein|nr:hypothetical protein [Nocardioidaceae bacterium]